MPVPYRYKGESGGKLLIPQVGWYRDTNRPFMYMKGRFCVYI